MTNEHDEPWQVTGNDITTNSGFSVSGGDCFDAFAPDADHAARIVACVNACKGFTNEQLAEGELVLFNKFTKTVFSGDRVGNPEAINAVIREWSDKPIG